MTAPDGDGACTAGWGLEAAGEKTQAAMKGGGSRLIGQVGGRCRACLAAARQAERKIVAKYARYGRGRRWGRGYGKIRDDGEYREAGSPQRAFR